MNLRSLAKGTVERATMLDFLANSTIIYCQLTVARGINNMAPNDDGDFN